MDTEKKIDPATIATVRIGTGDGTEVYGWPGSARLDTKVATSKKTKETKTTKTLLIFGSPDPVTKTVQPSLFDGSEWTDKVSLTGDALAGFLTAIGGEAKVKTWTVATKARTGRKEETTIILPATVGVGSETARAAVTVTDEDRAAAVARHTKAAVA
jgi:hypothetical protein